MDVPARCTIVRTVGIGQRVGRRSTAVRGRETKHKSQSNSAQQKPVKSCLYSQGSFISVQYSLHSLNPDRSHPALASSLSFRSSV
jgi:hypothetical protein